MNGLFASGGQSIRASASDQSSSEYPGLISSKIDEFDLLVFQGTLNSVLQYHSSKASILQHTVIVQLLHLYMTTGKTIGLIIRTFVSNMISLLF